MCDIFNFFWEQGAHMFFWKEKQSWSILFPTIKYFQWISCFKISLDDDNVNQMSQITRDYMWSLSEAL